MAVPTLRDLALFLSPTVVYGEVNPAAFEIVDDIVWGSGSARDFFDALDAAIDRLALAYDKLAVSYSGGVDSAYCLHRLCKIRGPEAVTPIYFGARTDNVAHYSAIVSRSLDAIAPGCRLEVVRQPRDSTWSPAGPSLHSAPSAVAAVEMRAQHVGAGVLITGCGADEIVAAPKYLGADLLWQLEIRTLAARFHQAVSIGVGGMLEEFIVPLLSRAVRVSAEQQFAFALEEAHFPAPYELLATPYRSHCEEWTKTLYEELRRKCFSQASSLAETDAFLSIFPMSRLSSVTSCGVAMEHPFQEPEVVRAGLQVPFTDKVGSLKESVYKRRKTLLYSRMPPAFQRCVPDHKVGYSSYLGETSHYDEAGHKLLQGLGFLDAGVRVASLDLSTRMVLASIVRWLEGAELSGYTLVTE